MLKTDEGISPFEGPTTNQDCPWLTKIIKKEFKLKTDEDAKVLEAALDVLYPISDHFGGRDHKAKAIRKEDGRFVFVRGVFFKDLKGFVVETGENGSISKVSYSLKLEKE